MAACLRSLRLGVMPLVPGGAGGKAATLGGKATHRGKQCGVQTAATLHQSSSTLKATPAPLQQQQQQQQQKVEGEVEAAAGWMASSLLPLHSFDPLGFTLCPAAHTLDDIEVQCGNDNLTNAEPTTPTTTPNRTTSIRTFRLPPNALWYPRHSTRQGGAVLCSLAYSPIEAEVINKAGNLCHEPHTPHEPHAPHPQEAPYNLYPPHPRDKIGVQTIITRENGAVQGKYRDNIGENRDIIGDNRDIIGENRDNIGQNRDIIGGNRDIIGDNRDILGENRDIIGENRDIIGENRDILGAQTRENGGICDMGLFIQSMGLRDGEVQMCGGPPDSSSSSSSPGKEDVSGRPDAEQLSYVFNKLADTLPKLFIQPLDYTIYSQNIVFENRIRGIRTVGLFPYVRQVALLRTVGHLKFAYVKFEILKITKHPEEGCIKVRWRIQGLSGLKALFRFWKIKFWDWSSVQQQMVSWYDGFSTFTVGADGLVHTHTADSMMPDEESKLANKNTLAVKMATLLGLYHRPNRGSLNTTTTTTPSTTTTTTAATATELLQRDRECVEGLMLPLEKIH